MTHHREPRAWLWLCALGWLVQTATASLPASAQPVWPGPTGGSGVNGDPRIDRASVEAFGVWRGRPINIASVYTERKNWDTMTRGSGWLFDNLSGFRGRLVVSQGLVPEGRAADLPACAAGAYDQHWRDFGGLLVNKGRGDSIVRLGWEFNGDYVPWAATNTQQWIACYRRAALAIRSTNPRVQFDWTINAHGTPGTLCGGNSLNCYPGDDVVDIIGIDNYDMAPSSHSEADFNRIASEPDGLSWLYDFALARRKRFAVGEWGVAPWSDYNTSGENPNFIHWMHKWFRAHAGNLAYEAYFNHCDAGVGSNIFRAAQSGCPRNGSAGTMYKMLFRDAAILPWPDPRDP